MSKLADYLDISDAQALSQWRSVRARAPRPSTARWRQVDFLPVETLLCLAAALTVNHRRYGGSTSHLAPTPVPELAACSKGLRRRSWLSFLGEEALGCRIEPEALGEVGVELELDRVGLAGLGEAFEELMAVADERQVPAENFLSGGPPSEPLSNGQAAGIDHRPPVRVDHRVAENRSAGPGRGAPALGS